MLLFQNDENELLVYYISCISYYVDPIGHTGTSSLNNYLANLNKLDQAPKLEETLIYLQESNKVLKSMND